jgi:hypothetical protein
LFKVISPWTVFNQTGNLVYQGEYDVHDSPYWR